jgi:two-component system sensor histidine kinase CpxA
LRSPLARINLSLAILKKRSLPESDNMFQRLDRDVSRIDLLMGQLLMLSRLEAGLSSAEREDVDFARLIEETAADSNFEAQASGKSVSLRTNGPVILGNSDPHALRSACENVIRNAVRFTQPGTDVEIVLEIDRSTSEPFAQLTVRDHGPGVPEESLEAIFQPFFRITANQKVSQGMDSALLSRLKRLVYIGEPYMPQICFPLVLKSRFDCPSHTKQRSMAMSYRSPSTT